VANFFENSHFEINPEKSPPAAGFFRPSKREARAQMSQASRLEVRKKPACGGLFSGFISK